MKNKKNIKEKLSDFREDVVKSARDGFIFSLLFIFVAYYPLVSFFKLFDGFDPNFLTNFITVTISLAGFVLVEAFFDKSYSSVKKQLLGISKSFIYSAVSFIVLYAVLPFSNVLTPNSISGNILLIVMIFAPVIAAWYFSTGIVKLIDVIEGIINKTKPKKRRKK